ncbi:hypothetical protein D3C86_1322480 [compost metagenome]
MVAHRPQQGLRELPDHVRAGQAPEVRQEHRAVVGLHAHHRDEPGHLARCGVGHVLGHLREEHHIAQVGKADADDLQAILHAYRFRHVNVAAAALRRLRGKHARDQSGANVVVHRATKIASQKAAYPAFFKPGC